MENNIIKSLVLGLSAMVGFIVTEKVYEAGIRIVQREREKNLIDMEEIPVVEEIESSSQDSFIFRIFYTLFYEREVIIMKLKKTDLMCKVTRKVVDDFNTLSDQAFFNKYSVSKRTYLKRVIKYGDPYMNSPLAKIRKFLNKIR